MLLWWGFRPYPVFSVVAAVGFLIVFAALVAHHARVLARVEAAEAGRQVALRAIARIDRDWTMLPDVGGPAGFCLDDHPYARDLDLFGHASLASWLGRAATPTGEYRLFGWLLAADQPDDIAIRQQAVDDLASRAEWRETLAIEGLLGGQLRLTCPPQQAFDRQGFAPLGTRARSSTACCRMAISSGWSAASSHPNSLYSPVGVAARPSQLASDAWPKRSRSRAYG